MGRFKIYDSKELVSIISDSNYAKCMLCEKKLKNIMGNIKRHYEQMHSVCLNAKERKAKRCRKKTAKFRDDKDFKISNKPKRKTREINKKNGMINIMNEMKEIQIPTSISFDPNPVLSFPENAKGYNHHITITTYNQEPTLQENKLKGSEQQRFEYSDDDNDEIQIPCHSYINNIQIDSMDSCQPFEFLKCLVETKTHVNIPLTIFQKADTFQKALESWKPNFQFNYSSKAIGEHIDRMAKKLRHEIIQLVANRIIYLKLDVISSTQGNLMFVNIQFFNDFKIQVITLSVLELSDDDLATNLKQKVLTALERYKIDIGRVHSIVKDISSNFAKSSLKHNDKGGLLQFFNENMNFSIVPPQSVDYSQHLSDNFPGHAIHFVATDIIKQLNENISQSRDSVISLRGQMSQLDIKNIPLLDYGTSWISIYDMIESLLKIRDIIETNKQIVAEVDWLFASKFESGFRPIVDTALMLQSNDIITMGDFYREWLLCELKLGELMDTNEIALYLLKAFRKRKAVLFQNTSFLSALYIDPRFCYKGSIHFSDKQKEVAITQLLEIFIKLKAVNADTTSPSSTNSTYDRYSKLDKIAASYLKTNVETITSYDTVCLANVDENWVKQSLVLLQFENRLSFEANILNYWNTVKHKNPVLAKIAEIALGAPATQATINRVLNISSLSLIRRKLNENTDNTENLLLLKLNQDLVNKITLEN